MSDRPAIRVPVSPMGLVPNSVIGIVGGGQLGRMSAIAAARLGYRAHIFSPEADGPAAQVAAGITVGGYDDPEALRAFAACVDVVTFEFENISAPGLDLLASLRTVRPSPAILRVSQDRVTEKSFINGAGVATAAWAPVNNEQELRSALRALGLPAVLKTTRLGYDGRGQAVVRSEQEAEDAWERLAPRPLIVEQKVDFACELGVIVARGPSGEVVCYDTVENRHRNGILDLTYAPARVPPQIAEDARQLACRIATSLSLEGLLAVEMFVDRDGRVLVNEIAPRPHNCGHWTIDGCAVSQFEMHIRAVAGLPLHAPVRHSDAVMRNLIGLDDMSLWPEILRMPGMIPHLYGKAEVRPGRKMGHATHLFPRGALPGDLGISDALGRLARTDDA